MKPYEDPNQEKYTRQDYEDTASSLKMREEDKKILEEQGLDKSIEKYRKEHPWVNDGHVEYWKTTEEGEGKYRRHIEEYSIEDARKALEYLYDKLHGQANKENKEYDEKVLKVEELSKALSLAIDDLESFKKS